MVVGSVLGNFPKVKNENCSTATFNCVPKKTENEQQEEQNHTLAVFHCYFSVSVLKFKKTGLQTDDLPGKINKIKCMLITSINQVVPQI